MNSTKINNHPALKQAHELADICRPLQLFNISYFGHIFIDNHGKLSALGINPEFFQHYFEHEYHDADIHMAENDKFGRYVIWDEIERSGKSEKMHSEAAQFGVQHTFTIIEKNHSGSHYYHFANDSSSKYINQVYLGNLDLLTLFIQHFNENVSQSKLLASAYDIKFSLDKKNGGYFTRNTDKIIITNKKRTEFVRYLNITPAFQAIKRISTILHTKGIHLSKREIEIIAHLTRGNTARLIADILALSPRTIEAHIERIKNKMGVFSKSEIISTLIDCLF